MAIHHVDEDRGSLFRRDVSGDRSKMEHFAETVDEGKHTSAPLSVSGQPEDEVHADRRPYVRGDWKRSKRSLLGRIRLHVWCSGIGQNPVKA